MKGNNKQVLSKGCDIFVAHLCVTKLPQVEGNASGGIFSFLLLLLLLFHNTRQSPGEIKRREVSWTLTKKLLAQKRSRAGRWCWAGELDFFCFSCFPTVELWMLSL